MPDPDKQQRPGIPDVPRGPAAAFDTSIVAFDKSYFTIEHFQIDVIGSTRYLLGRTRCNPESFVALRDLMSKQIEAYEDQYGPIESRVKIAQPGDVPPVEPH